MKYRILISLFAAGLLLPGCSKDTHEGNGRLRINFSVDTDVIEATRALDGLTAPAAEEFDLRVVKDGGGFDETWARITDFPDEGYFIATGNYTATATCGDIEQEGFGHPCFGVTKAFSVIDQTTTPVTLVARLLNTAVTVGYTEAFEGYFPQHYAVISRGGTPVADFSNDPGGIAFIKPEAFRITVYYTYQDNGIARSGSTGFDVTENVIPQYHLNIKLDLNGGNVGAASIEVSFNDDVETIRIPIEVGGGR